MTRHENRNNQNTAAPSCNKASCFGAAMSACNRMKDEKDTAFAVSVFVLFCLLCFRLLILLWGSGLTLIAILLSCIPFFIRIPFFSAFGGRRSHGWGRS